VHAFGPNWKEDSRDAMKVLVVNSDPQRVKSLALELQHDGWVPLQATTYEEAKRLWAAEKPPTLIADIRLGQFNGLQLLLRARAERPDVSALITCPFPDKVLEAETIKFGGTFIATPLTPKEIVSLLRSSRPMKALGVLGERRAGERRQTTMTTIPDRRLADRRRATPRH
jgi:DNA-binding response OmpR family regulator